MTDRAKRTGRPPLDLSGHPPFGALTARRPVGRDRRGSVLWECECACGRVVAVPASSLRSGNNTSCGCRRGRYDNATRQFARARRALAAELYATGDYTLREVGRMLGGVSAAAVCGLIRRWREDNQNHEAKEY